VVRIIDGDTIEVSVDARTERVRLIGIDTPETKGATAAEGALATESTRGLLQGRTVVLERDVSERDRYGRLLRYVWLHGDGWTLVNEEIVRRGFAQTATYPPDVRYAEAFLAAEREAREAGRGLWGAATTAPRQDPSGGADCDPSYPAVCIPPYPPDLDCGEVGFRRFTVVPPDRHGFDGDHDGVGCESG
jgi:micrococcal nuclease